MSEPDEHLRLSAEALREALDLARARGQEPEPAWPMSKALADAIRAANAARDSKQNANSPD